MGVKDLWTILGPFCERKPLFELQGKTVAIDLSCWVCEAQNISEYQVQPRMYLRNLYFRTCYLLLLQVNPVFVLEGKAPTLKYGTIAARNAIQFKGAKPKTDQIKTGKDRSKFNFTLKQCEEMLGYMGLACVKGSGEAEATCAYLNEDGLVEGCISQDSDCFAYGAKKVYRNFSISQQGVHSASGGAVDVYDIEKFNKSSDFGRYKIIALALLCGSDYSDGVFGIGKDSALKLFDNVPDDDILDRLRSWRKDVAFYDDLNKKISDRNVCTSCGHFGKLQSHNKTGCRDCNTSNCCDSDTFKNERLAIKNELNIREKALRDPGFPNEDLIKEFLIRKDSETRLDLKWKQPDLIQFVKFCTKYLQWEEIYTFEKILPILTRWQLLNYAYIQDKMKQAAKIRGILYPHHIKKIRKPKGIPSYEIIWKDQDDCFQGLIPEVQLVGVVAEKLWSTIEPQDLVNKAYPELVDTYQQSKIKPKKTNRRRKKDNVEEIEKLLQNTSISEPKPKTRKRATKTKTKKETIGELEKNVGELNMKETSKTKQKTLDSYLKKAVVNSMEKQIKGEDIISQKLSFDNFETCLSKFGDEQIQHTKNDAISQIQTEIHESKSVRLCDSFDLDLSNFGDECDTDLSAIIDSITQKPPKYINTNLQKMSILTAQEKLDCGLNNLNRSSFFITETVENDLFEITFNRNDDDDTEEYDLDDQLLTYVNENNKST